VSKQFSSKRAPIRIEILSSAENIPGLDKDLHEILRDASNSCEFSSYVDKNGEIRVMIECMVDEDEKERVWDLLRFKHKRDCSISSEPSELLPDTSSELITDFNDDIRVEGDFKN
jgi:cobalamin biosynthesis protein CbiD